MDEQGLPKDEATLEKVVQAIRELMKKYALPSAWELLDELEKKLTPKARWLVKSAIRKLIEEGAVGSEAKAYLKEVLECGDLDLALDGCAKPGKEIESTIDALFRSSAAYRSSEEFQEMLRFMAGFRDYAPYNNMLVRLQNPSCSFFATAAHWKKKFNRDLIEDARPMVILAPRHPVMFVFDLDHTKGPELPKEVREFATFKGQWNPERLALTVRNARERDLIDIKFKELSSTHAGFAAVTLGHGDPALRIVVHDKSDDRSRYGVLCHELAHIYLGHFGTYGKKWWPARGNLERRAMEIEAEAVAYVVTQRAGLSGTSFRYISGYFTDEAIRMSVSVDQIAKVAGRLEEMATRTLPKRKKQEQAGTQRSLFDKNDEAEER